ncbi:MAG: hypothetical protein AAFP02_18720, partial [Bacteroidota bacterium]
MSLLTKSNYAQTSLSDTLTFTQKPYAYLTVPDPSAPTQFSARVMALLTFTYQSAPVISQTVSGTTQYLDIDLGLRQASVPEYGWDQTVEVSQSTGTDLLVVRLFENAGSGKVQIGEVTLLFAEADDESLSNYSPAAYIVNTPEGDENTAVSVLIPLSDYEISSSSVSYDTSSKTWEIKLEVASGTGSNPLQYGTYLDMSE